MHMRPEQDNFRRIVIRIVRLEMRIPCLFGLYILFLCALNLYNMDGEMFTLPLEDSQPLVPMD